MSTYSNISEPRISIIILNYNCWKDTLECLESVYQADYSNYDVIVIDNGSSDDSIEKLRNYVSGRFEVDSKFVVYSKKNKPMRLFEYLAEVKSSFDTRCYEDSPSDRRMILIKNRRNYGFAEGNNMGIKFALTFFNPKYILLLNNDVIVDKQFLKELVKVARSDERIGIVGPKIYYYDFFGRSDIINFAGEDIILWKVKGVRYGFNEEDRGQYNKIREVDKIDGACMLIKSEIFQKVGFFDPGFFLYWEETDFCFRTKNKGFSLVYVPSSVIWHKFAKSIGGLFNKRRVYYMTRNRFLFVKRNVHGLNRFLFLVYFFAWNIWFDIGYFLKHRQVTALVSYLQGVIGGLRLLYDYKR